MTSYLVLLHGWGASAADLAPLAEVLQAPDRQVLRWQAPHQRPMGGYMWYDLMALETDPVPWGLPESRQYLQTSLANLPLERTVLAGFSQGGAMALDVGLTLPLAGVISFSGYLHATNTPPQPLPPVALFHGQNDEMVPAIAARSARQTLSRWGATVTYAEFVGGHTIVPEAIAAAQSFLGTVLPP
ncbi:MAG: alpha/beta hydrolase [Oscillatoriales cyanobacterium SM2_1_8]|nr:alpha/beta hydrolase [Oscillatoriales cyanobacterium SM2_1_8]